MTARLPGQEKPLAKGKKHVCFVHTTQLLPMVMNFLLSCRCDPNSARKPMPPIKIRFSNRGDSRKCTKAQSAIPHIIGWRVIRKTPCTFPFAARRASGMGMAGLEKKEPISNREANSMRALYITHNIASPTPVATQKGVVASMAR